MTPPSSDTASPLLAALTARSERQAMDWGLALISQGIPAVIDREEVSARQFDEASEGAFEKASEEPIAGAVDHPPHPPHPGPSPQGVRRSRWCLRVEPDALERARAVILEYRRENRRFAWHRTAIAARPLSWNPTAVPWVLVLCAIHALLSMALRSAGWVEASSVRQHGQWWRLFTATWLHADVAHLASNVGTGALTLGFAMGRYGPGTALCLSVVAGAAANIPGVLLRDPTARALGASGVVMAALGLLVGHAVVWWRISRHASKPVWISLGAGVFLFLSLGVNPVSDVLAHAGGFVGGILLGALAAWFRWGRFEKLWALAYAVLAVGPWLCAWVARGR
jgi:membrane associated rhomboid family serine protease